MTVCSGIRAQSEPTKEMKACSHRMHYQCMLKGVSHECESEAH